MVIIDKEQYYRACNLGEHKKWHKFIGLPDNEFVIFDDSKDDKDIFDFVSNKVKQLRESNEWRNFNFREEIKCFKPDYKKEIPEKKSTDSDSLTIQSLLAELKDEKNKWTVKSLKNQFIKLLEILENE